MQRVSHQNGLGGRCEIQSGSQGSDREHALVDLVQGDMHEPLQWRCCACAHELPAGSFWRDAEARASGYLSVRIGDLLEALHIESESDVGAVRSTTLKIDYRMNRAHLQHPPQAYKHRWELRNLAHLDMLNGPTLARAFNFSVVVLLGLKCMGLAFTFFKPWQEITMHFQNHGGGASGRK